jgi:CubicO group peptidase (beta-lactamase class C family)
MHAISKIRTRLLIFSFCLYATISNGSESAAVALPGYQPGAGISKESVEEIMNWALDTYRCPGASIAIIMDGDIFVVEGFGVRDVETGKPVYGDTLFQLASVSKTFTASAFGVAVDKEQLGWEQPAREVLPDFEMSVPYATKWVSGKDFFVHRSGFPGFFGDLFDHLGYSRSDIRHRIRFVEPGYSFREHPEYSNLGFFIAGEMVAQTGGGSFEDVLKKTILDPLSMENTGKAETLLARVPEDFAAAHVSKDGTNEVVPHNLSKVFVSAGGLASSSDDLSRYLQMLLNDGMFEGKRILSQNAIETIFEPVITADISFSEFPPIDQNSGFDYAPSWGVYDYNGLKVLEKGGALDGVRTIIVLVPEEKFGVAILSNMNLTSLPEAVRAGLLQQMFGRVGEKDLQPIIREKADDIDKLVFGDGGGEKVDHHLTPEQVKAFVGSYNSDLFGMWEVVEDAQVDSGLILFCGAAQYPAEVTIISANKLRFKFPIVLSDVDEAEFLIEPGGAALSFTFQGYEFRRQGR